MVLRFQSPTARRRSHLPTSGRLRLWLLFAAACVVMFSIRLLREPETVERIDSLFIPTIQAGDQPVTINEVLAAESTAVGSEPVVVSSADDLPTVRRNPALNSRFDLSTVRDNTYFRTEENSAWFDVWEWLMSAPATLLRDESVGDTSYAQFIDQPDVYRGQVVKVRGTVEREELLKAPANDLGIEQYHRLIVRPAGGGVWPFVVYTLKLPHDFPRGDNVNVDVDVHGVFFKNWSYAWQKGLGLAPVVLAQSPDWHRDIRLPRHTSRVSASRLVAVIASAGLIATLVGWFAWQHTRRPRNIGDDQEVIIVPPAEEGRP